MKAKRLWIISEWVMVVLLACMAVNWYVKPFPAWLIECIGVLLIVNLAILVYSFIRFRKEQKK